MPTRVAQVLLDSPLPQLDHLFDYAIPASLQESVVIGCRVRVPLRMGNRRVDAFVVSIVDESSFAGTLQEIDSVISPVSLLPHGLYSLARQVAERQAGSASDVLRLAIPPRYVRAEKSFYSDDAVENRREMRAAPALSQSALETLTSVSAVRDDLAAPFADFPHGTCRSVVVPPGSTQIDDKHVPTWALMFAVEAAHTLQRGESTICVVPAFRDIDDVLLGLAVLGLSESVVRLDTRQTGGERYSGYLRVLEDQPVVVVGNRSAVYAPVHNPGLFLFWDDGDPVLQEPLAPYAHPRDVALLESKNSGARLVFAGFTVSIEVQRLVELKFASAWSAARSAYPKVVPTDSLTNEQSRARIPSAAWAHASEQRLLRRMSHEGVVFCVFGPSRHWFFFLTAILSLVRADRWAMAVQRMWWVKAPTDIFRVRANRRRSRSRLSQHENHRVGWRAHGDTCRERTLRCGRAPGG